jgi:hypothetical protein
MYERIQADEETYNLIPEKCTTSHTAAEHNNCRCSRRFNWAVAFVSSLSLVTNLLLVLILVHRENSSSYGILPLGLLNNKIS